MPARSDRAVGRLTGFWEAFVARMDAVRSCRLPCPPAHRQATPCPAVSEVQAEGSARPRLAACSQFDWATEPRTTTHQTPSLLHRGVSGASGRPRRGRNINLSRIPQLEQRLSETSPHPVPRKQIVPAPSARDLKDPPTPLAAAGPKHSAPPDARGPLHPESHGNS